LSAARAPRVRFRLAPPEGLTEPSSFVDHLPKTLAPDELAAIMGGNLARVMKVGIRA
jgi:hypothetical protein